MPYIVHGHVCNAHTRNEVTHHYVQSFQLVTCTLSICFNKQIRMSVSTNFSLGLSQVGPSLGYVPRSAQLYSCCAATAYSLSIAAEVPPMATSIRIAINGTLGDLPYGVLVSFTDRAETEVGIGKWMDGWMGCSLRFKAGHFVAKLTR